MKIYIRSTGNISPQKTFAQSAFLSEPIWCNDNRLSCIEPDYKTMIDPKMIRRMSRIIKMGVGAAMECLQNAGSPMPEAIITGTAYGCLEDTGLFLTKLIENNEEFLTPTAFIQSTHNTVSAQIALMLSCHHYNNTIVHRGFSFEHALLDAQMLMEENEAGTILVGGIDEITDSSHAILSRFGLYKNEKISTAELFNTSTKGTIAGEGASFFLISKQYQKNDHVCLEKFATYYKPSGFSAIQDFILSFLKDQQINQHDIDMVIYGKNGDVKKDAMYNQVETNIFPDTASVNFKHLCGEYPTASSFALWLATNILQTNSVPPYLSKKLSPKRKIKYVLIYNHYLNVHHSLYLLSAC